MTQPSDKAMRLATKICDAIKSDPYSAADADYMAKAIDAHTQAAVREATEPLKDELTRAHAVVDELVEKSAYVLMQLDEFGETNSLIVDGVEWKGLVKPYLIGLHTALATAKAFKEKVR